MADLRRFFVDKVFDVTTVSGEEFSHAVSVLRIRENEEIILCDNSGVEYFAKIDKINKKDFTTSVFDKRKSETEPKTKLTLIIGYLKGDKTELVVQKAVELGVSEIVVFSSQFSSAFMNENKLARLNKVSVEAAKQCKRAVAPKVSYAKDFPTALDFAKNAKNKLFACEFATKNETDFNSLSGETAIVVGSEGGFSHEEYSLAKSLGFSTVYLGKRILRAETAGIALSAIIMNALHEFD